MVEYELKYGKTLQKLTLEDGYDVSFILSKEEILIKQEEAIIREALENPIDSLKLREIVKPGERICVVIPDVTRLWQKPSLYLSMIIEELEKSGVRDDDIDFLCALGSHRKQTEQEHKQLLGEDLYKRFRITDHDCRDDSKLQYVGTTSYGTSVKVNKLALECDHIIITGGIVFHDMAGFGGGRKAILPGISSYETIMANHSLSLNMEGHGSNPLVKSAAFESNPFNLDMMEAVKFVKPSFLLNVMTNSEGRISGAVAGHYINAHLKGCEILKNIDGVKLQGKADLVIASCGGYPKDIDLYQASKALTNAREAAKSGGTVIIVAECNEGFGHPEVEHIINDFKTNLEREGELRVNYTIAKYIGFLMCEIAEEFNVIFVTGIQEGSLKNCNIKLMKDIVSALKCINLNQKDFSRVYIMPSGANTLPLESCTNME